MLHFSCYTYTTHREDTYILVGDFPFPFSLTVFRKEHTHQQAIQVYHNNMSSYSRMQVRQTTLCVSRHLYVTHFRALRNLFASLRNYAECPTSVSCALQIRSADTFISRRTQFKSVPTRVVFEECACVFSVPIYTRTILCNSSVSVVSIFIPTIRRCRKFPSVSLTLLLCSFHIYHGMAMYSHRRLITAPFSAYSTYS